MDFSKSGCLLDILKYVEMYEKSVPDHRDDYH